MLEKLNYHLMTAYALGYYDGRSIGEQNNPYQGGLNQSIYVQGYDHGVSDYCREKHPEDDKTEKVSA